MRKEALSSSRAPQPAGTYSQAIRWGPLLFTAGIGPVDPLTGRIVGTSIEEQTERVMQSLSLLLDDHGLTLDDALKVTVHLQNLARDFPGFDAVYRRFFSMPYPVRTTVGSQLNAILVEVDCICGYRT